MKKICIKKVFVLLFFLLSVSPMIGIVMINIINNGLKFPEFKFNEWVKGEYQREVSEYFSENLLVCKPIISFKTNLDLLMGKNFINGIYVKDESLINIPHLPDIEDLDHVSTRINAFAKNVKVPMFSFIIPTKAQVSSEQLKVLSFRDNELELMNYFKNKTGASVSNLDSRTPLVNVKDIDVFYKTDRKINSIGAFLIYNYNIKQLGGATLDLQKFNIEHVTDGFYGDLYNRILYFGIKPENVDLFRYRGYDVKANVTQIYDDGSESFRDSLYDRNELKGSNKSQVLFGEKAATKIVETNLNTEKKRLLIFADKNVDAFIQFFAIHYSEITVVDLGELGNFQDAIENIAKKVDVVSHDQVLFLYSMESLSDRNEFDKLRFFK